ncbi:unnamed protein product [Paramecium pentaurelia]|uniref:Uncharacterized protein n=1 Tax=Paramecium pentaurelia TaxID=43138 RepID=A0A8S1XR24_9CILI|nr:unnamed protein product [Paramecium pentaurelia]
MKQNFCPDLHVTVPDMDLHICVSYAEICKDVPEVDILVAQNGTQYVCHPRFQPFAPGTPTIDFFGSINCGYEEGVQMVIEQLLDYHLKFYCKFIEGENYKNCLATEIVNGYQRCAYCKAPFVGESCLKLTQGFYDWRYFNPPKKCESITCIECDNPSSCTKCAPGYGSTTPANTCDKWLDSTPPCKEGTYLETVDKCFFCPEGCLSCRKRSASTQPSVTCDVCDSRYFKVKCRQDDPDCYFCFIGTGCDFDRQQILTDYTTLNALGQYQYVISCTQCDLGFFYSKEKKKCECNIQQYFEILRIFRVIVQFMTQFQKNV